MRGIRIKLSVFEYDIFKTTLRNTLATKQTEEVRKALWSILRQFETKIERAKLNGRYRNA